MDIIAAYREVGSLRGAAAICGTTDKTVKRVLARHEAGRDDAPPRPRERNYDGVVALVADRVAKTRGRISAKRLLPAARVAGYAGSARNFRRLVATQKALWRQENHRGRRPAVWSPGQYLVIDWGEIDWAGAGRLHVFCAVLAWCRVRFVRFAADERAATTLRLLAECFEILGGVPAVVLADRMGCLKGAVVAGRVVPTGEYLRFAAHYGFRPDFCEAADPQSKGIVEHLVGYAKSDLVVPGSDGSGAPFDDLVTANVAAAAWCTQVNATAHSEISAVPAERLCVERELLGSLPSLRPSIGRMLTRKVDRLACVRFGSARYSVPVRLIGTQVRLRTDDGRLLTILTEDGQVVAEHQLVAPGEASISDAHYGGPRPAVPARAVRPKTAAEQQFCALGPVAEAFLVGAVAAGNTRLGPELAELNTLAAAHGCQPFLDALSRATAFGRWRAADVRSILAAGAGTPQPAPAGDALILQLPVVPTRSLADYALHPAVAEPVAEPQPQTQTQTQTSSTATGIGS
jgi:transposase